VIADGGDGFLVHLVAAPDGHDVGTKPSTGSARPTCYGGRSPRTTGGRSASPSGGWVRPLGPNGQIGERMGRAANVVLVARTGDIVSRIRTGGRTLSEPPAYGLTLDSLQRALGLATAPPLVNTDHTSPRCGWKVSLP
jgi:hypothetical protein